MRTDPSRRQTVGAPDTSGPPGVQQAHDASVQELPVPSKWESHLPFGGRAGLLCCSGRVGDRFSIEGLVELKTIVVNLA